MGLAGACTVAPPVVSVAMAMATSTVGEHAVCASRVKLTDVPARLIAEGAPICTKSQLCACDWLLQPRPARASRTSAAALANLFDAACNARRPRAALLWKSIAFPLDCGYNFASSIAAGAPLKGPWRGPHCFPSEPCP